MASIAIAAIIAVTTLVDTSIVSKSHVISSVQRLKHMGNSVRNLLNTATAVRERLSVVSVGYLLKYIPLKTTISKTGPISEKHRLRITAINRSKRIEAMLRKQPSRKIAAVDNMRITTLESNLIKRVFE